MTLLRDREYYPATLEELRAALEAASAGRSLPLLLAHVAIENGCSTGACTGLANYNLGNLTLSEQQTETQPHWRPPWYDPPDEDTPERYRELHEQMLHGKAPRAFRAYDSLAEGADAYVRRLESRFPTMLEARTARSFAQAWRDSGYTPDLDVEQTTRTLRSVLERTGGPSGGSAAAVALLAAAGAGVIFWRARK